ncbi:S100 calcium binding protein V1 isoform 2-T2 [Synchiropus picturatus]
MAINSLVTNFHKSSADGSTLNSTEFQTMIAQQLPTFSKTMEGDGGLEKVMQMMGVENDQNISFDNFWNLVHKQAVQAFNSTYKEPDAKCNCSLQ